MIDRWRVRAAHSLQFLRAALERRVGGLLVLRRLVESAERLAANETTPEEHISNVLGLLKRTAANPWRRRPTTDASGSYRSASLPLTRRGTLITGRRWVRRETRRNCRRDSHQRADLRGTRAHANSGRAHTHGLLPMFGWGVAFEHNRRTLPRSSASTRGALRENCFATSRPRSDRLARMKIGLISPGEELGSDPEPGGAKS